MVEGRRRERTRRNRRRALAPPRFHRRRVRLSFNKIMIAILIVLLIIYMVLYFFVNTTKTKPVAPRNLTASEEYEIRREQGFLDNIRLGKLLEHTLVQNRHMSKCPAGTKAVILVQSACSNQAHRQAIRQTWGKRAELAGIMVLFFLGQCPESWEDIQSHDDIFQLDFVDSYYNNTLKTLSRFRWFVQYCSKSEYLIMTDDDAVIVVPVLLNFLRKGMTFSIVGPYYEKGTNVIRDRNSKWYVPTWVYPASKYPEYIGGGTFIIGGPVVIPLFIRSLGVPFMTIDDVLFNGIVAGAVGITKLEDPRFPRMTIQSVACDDNSTIASQGYTPEEMVKYWERWVEVCESDEIQLVYE